MKVIRDIENFSTEKPHAVALGNFDGFHLGHKAITDKLKETAQSKKLIPSVVTFDPHPMKFFGRQLQLIMSEEAKINSFAEAGVEEMFIIEFSKKFADIDPEVFVREYLVEKLHVKAVIVGYDYCFGKGRTGDFNLIRKLGMKYDFSAVQVDKVECSGTTASSTNIRQLIIEGKVDEAAKLLGKPFFIEGKVTDGSKIGRTLGFPTANIEYRNELIPKCGIYVSMAIIDGVRMKSVTNIGIRPTVTDEKIIKIETHILNYSGNLYGKDIEVELLAYVRPEVKFSGKDELMAAIHADCAYAEKWFEEKGY